MKADSRNFLLRLTDSDFVPNLKKVQELAATSVRSLQPADGSESGIIPSEKTAENLARAKDLVALLAWRLGGDDYYEMIGKVQGQLEQLFAEGLPSAQEEPESDSSDDEPIMEENPRKRQKCTNCGKHTK